MKIKSVRFANFKRIANTRIEFNEDLNIFVGANNSGKTSVLEAIGLLLGIKNIKPSKVLSYYLQGNGRVDIKITLQLSKQEWESLLKIEASIDKRYEIFFNEEYLQSLTNEFTLHLSVIIDFKSNQNISQNNASYIVDLDQSQKTFTEENIQLLNKIAKNILGYDKFYLFNNPLYIDSNDIIVDEEDFIPEKDLINKGMGYKNRVRAKLYYLKQNDLEKFEQIKKEILETFPEIKDFDIVFNMQEGKFEFNIQESIRKNGHFVDVNYDVVDVGMGMKNLLLIVANILLTQPSVVLMDEPDAHMHPILIKKFVQILQKFSSETQFFITTHNIIFVNTVELSKIYSINYIPTEKGSIIKKLNETNEVLDLTNRLGYEISNFNYTTNPKVYVFCEGKTDKDIIISFAKKLNVSNKINDFNTCFIPLEGKNDVNKLITLIKKLETNIIKEPFLFLIDKDEVTKEKLEEFKKKHFKENPNRLFFLAKRQIENYLIDINALEKIILS